MYARNRFEPSRCTQTFSPEFSSQRKHEPSDPSPFTSHQSRINSQDLPAVAVHRPPSTAHFPLTPLFPLHTSHIATSPLFPLHTKNMGGGVPFSLALRPTCFRLIPPSFSRNLFPFTFFTKTPGVGDTERYLPRASRAHFGTVARVPFRES